MVRVRPATANDSTAVLTWRNDSDSRLFSRNSSEIDTETHEKWFQSVLSNPDRHIFIGEIESGDSIGQVRFDPRAEGDGYEVSISVAPERRGTGLALPLLTSAEKALRVTAVPTTLFAFVQSGHQASERLFRAAGYSITVRSSNETGNWWIKELHE